MWSEKNNFIQHTLPIAKILSVKNARAWVSMVSYLKELEIRIRDVEAFWYKTGIKIIYFVQFCLITLIVYDCMVYPDHKFLIFKTKNGLISFSEDGGLFFWSYVITQGICNKFIELNFFKGCMVCWTFVKYWWDK